jgi:hypothetical protein
MIFQTLFKSFISVARIIKNISASNLVTSQRIREQQMGGTIVPITTINDGGECSSPEMLVENNKMKSAYPTRQSDSITTNMRCVT